MRRAKKPPPGPPPARSKGSISTNSTEMFENPIRPSPAPRPTPRERAASKLSTTSLSLDETPLDVRFSSGDKVFVKDPTEEYVVCTVKSVDSTTDEITCFDDAYKTYKVPSSSVFPMNPPEMEAVGDNTNLMYLHDAALLHNVRERYNRDQIYTYTAFILIAVNPYQRLPIYTDENIKKYSESGFGRLPPHVYATASRAYRALKTSSVNQSIVVSGESGAGKTETCKHIMRFMASVCGDGGIDELEQRVLGSSPILESFGNAKTLRNNNSSRFGKFTELHFDSKAAICGASIDTYLLEKNRLISQTKGERSFHIFFELLAAAPDGHSAGGWDSYSYIGRSTCSTVERKDDAADFAAVVAAMAGLGMAAAEQRDIWNTLLALLELGNVEYVGVDGDSRDSAVIAKDELKKLEAAARLLGVDVNLLEQRTLHRMVKAGAGESIEVGLSAFEATNSRDAFAKFVYGSLFDWIVQRINAALGGSKGDADRFIGILDLSGFEIFETNSFEQFCINFANEKIQQYFNSQILQQEQEIYELEGLRFRKVEYVDNQPVIDVAEDRRSGVFALLDEACLMPRSSDQTFTTTVHSKHLGSKFLTAPINRRGVKKRLLEDEAFVVLHFAGEVTYETSRFLDKNNDTIHDELLAVLAGSANPFVRSLVPVVEAEECTYGPSGGRFKSVSANFSGQLGKLMGVLQKTTSHFIRCIKPNEMQKPMVLEPVSVMTQLRYSGMCAALILMQAGFPTRVSFQELYDRYKPHMPRQLLKLKPITFCEAILVALDLDGGRDFQMGLTKVFFRPGKLAQLNDALVSSDPADVDAVVRKVRLWLARKRFYAAGWSIVALNRIMVNVEHGRSFRQFRSIANVVVRIQRGVRPWIANVRKRLYDDGVYAKRQEEERVRTEKREAEDARKAEVEKKRREEVEKKRREEEAERQRKIEEDKKRKEEAWQAMVDKLAALSEINSQVTSQLASTVSRQAETQSKLEVESERRSAVETDLDATRQVLESAEGKIATMAKRHADAVVDAEARLDAEKQENTARMTAFAQSAAGDQADLMTKMQTSMEDKAATDKAKLAASESRLTEQQAVSDALTVDLASLQKRFDDQTAAKALENATATTQIAELEQTLDGTKSALEGTVAKLTSSLEEETHALAEARSKISFQQVQILDLQADLDELRADDDQLRIQLAEVQAAFEAVTAVLQEERHAREDQVYDLETMLAATRKQAVLDATVKDAMSAALRLDLQKTQENLQDEKVRTTTALKALAAGKSDVEDQLHETREMCKEAERVGAAQETELEKLEATITQLHHERRVLQEKAAQGLLSGAKLRGVYDSFYKGGKLDTELLSRLHGAGSFAALAVKASKVGKVEKQGGQNEKKWESRYFVIIDNFLVYFGGERDKAPKGAFRLDKSHVEAHDLSKVNRQHGLRVTDPRNQRSLTFAASSAEEQESWKVALEAGGLAL